MSHTDVEKGYNHAAHDNADPPSAYRLAAAAPPFRQFGNPAPLGLSAFAATTFVLSLINLSAHDVTVPNVVLGMAFFYGGLCQLLAGMWEFACGNTFGGTALSSYGGFWMSFAVILTPGFNVVPAYNGDVAMLEHALGFYLFAWFIFTFLMFICTLRASLAFVILFLTLDLAFLFLALDKLLDSTTCKKVGGVFGLLAAFTAWYCALAGLLNKDNSFFEVPVAHFPWSVEGKKRNA